MHYHFYIFNLYVEASMFKKSKQLKSEVTTEHFAHISETAMNMFLVWNTLHKQQFDVVQYTDKVEAMQDYNNRS